MARVLPVGADNHPVGPATDATDPIGAIGAIGYRDGRPWLKGSVPCIRHGWERLCYDSAPWEMEP